jgi:outer membrane receptor protein involved in Fe transport
MVDGGINSGNTAATCHQMPNLKTGENQEMADNTNQWGKRPDFKLKPIARIVKAQKCLHRVPLIAGTLLASSMALAADSGVIEEVVVTAQKRTESLQDVPISMQVLDDTRLQELGVKGFEDYVSFLPSVSFTSNGPGQAMIYMRGVSDGGDGNFSGTSPSVAMYVDEQPVTSIGRNLDVHIYDIARIEAIAGPQGTLFGASSQAGTIRIITNQPNPGQFEAGYDIGANSTDGGDMGYSAEGFVNIPLSETAAIRLVGWSKEDGGWIDQVAADLTFPRSGITVSNTGNANDAQNTVGDDVNELTNQGLRAALKIDLNDSWTGTASVMHQEQESDGVFADDPYGVGQGKVERFFDDSSNDEWTQYGINLKGDLGFAELNFNASVLDREVAYDIDYSAYSVYSSYVELYYTCDYYDSDGNYAAYTDCVDPRIQYEQDSEYKRQTYELRLQSTGDNRLNWVVGMFYEENEHEYENKWHIPTITRGRTNDDPGIAYAFESGKAIPLLPAHGNPDLYFATMQERNDEETAIFGELTYQFTDQLSGTAGVRFFDHESTLEGFTGSFFSCFNDQGNRLGGPSGSVSCGAGLDSDEDDQTIKLNLTYDFNEDFMAYVTFSEGFRPGGANRFETPVIPAIYKSDLVTNYELGWKATFADNTVRFNGSVYFMEWEDIQFTRFDPTVSLVGLTANAGEAEISGIEGDVLWMVNENWEISAAFSINEAELSQDYTRDTTPGATPDAPDGTDLPFTPDLKYSLSTRYQFDIGNFPSFAQVSYNYTDESYNDMFPSARLNQSDYSLVNASVGLDGGSWTVELFANNLTNEEAELFRYTRGGDDRVTANRPRTIGVRFSHRFE